MIDFEEINISCKLVATLIYKEKTTTNITQYMSVMWWERSGASKTLHGWDMPNKFFLVSEHKAGTWPRSVYWPDSVGQVVPAEVNSSGAVLDGLQ